MIKENNEDKYEKAEKNCLDYSVLNSDGKISVLIESTSKPQNRHLRTIQNMANKKKTP